MAREKIEKQKSEKKQQVKKPFKEMTPKEKTKKILGIIGSAFQMVLVVIALVMSVVVIVYTYDREANELPSLFGISFLTVESNSMDYDGVIAQSYYKGEKPSAEEYDYTKEKPIVGYEVGAQFADAYQFKIHDMIIVSEWEYGKSEDLKPGDVVTFYDPDIPVYNTEGEKIGWFNTHRVVSVSDDGMSIVTRGDNNPQNDEVKSVAQVKAVWTGNKISGWGEVINWIKDETHFLLVIVLPLALLFFYNVFMFIRELVKHNVDKNSKNLAVEKAAAVEAAKQAAIAEYLANLEKEKQAQEQLQESVIAEPVVEDKADNETIDDSKDSE